VELTAIEKYFTEEKLKQYFSKELISRKAVGVDSISTNKFSKNLDENLKFINRKLTRKEHKQIEEYLYSLELENGYIQELGEHEEEYVPEF